MSTLVTACGGGNTAEDVDPAHEEPFSQVDAIAHGSAPRIKSRRVILKAHCARRAGKTRHLICPTTIYVPGKLSYRRDQGVDKTLMERGAFGASTFDA